MVKTSVCSAWGFCYFLAHLFLCVWPSPPLCAPPLLSLGGRGGVGGPVAPPGPPPVVTSPRPAPSRPGPRAAGQSARPAGGSPLPRPKEGGGEGGPGGEG